MSGLIPRAFIDELLNRTDIVEFIDSYVPLKKRGTSHLACCPFHNEKNPSFNVVAKKQFYHCFGCGASGNAISFAMNYLHQSFSDAVETLAGRLGLSVPREGHTGKNQDSQNLYQFLSKVSSFYQKSLRSQGQAAIAYLKQRGISGEIAHTYQLGYAPPGWQTLETYFKSHKKELIATGMLIVKEEGGNTYDRYRQRIMFPIHDRHGRIIGFGGRAIEPQQKPKYLNSPETTLFQKSHELYGLHQVIQQQQPISSIIIVEGYIDVIALAQHGIRHAVATLGTATSTYHIQLLSKYTKQLLFCFDGDNAGRQAAWRALESCLPHLHTGLDARFIFLPDGHDPDSLVRQEGTTAFLQRLQGALSFHHFLLNTLTQDIDTTSLAGKSQLVNAAKPYLQKMIDSAYKQLLLDELARLTRLETHRLHALIEEKTAPTATPTTIKAITRTPVRVATALLLQHPEIYATCKQQLPATLDIEKQRVLQMLMQQINDNPEINTAQLIELWRNSPIFEGITKLAAWDHQVPMHALAKEFVDIVLFLAKQQREKTIQQLLEKAHHQGLTEDERLNLQEKLMAKHKNTDV